MILWPVINARLSLFTATYCGNLCVNLICGLLRNRARFDQKLCGARTAILISEKLSGPALVNAIFKINERVALLLAGRYEKCTCVDFSFRGSVKCCYNWVGDAVREITVFVFRCLISCYIYNMRMIQLKSSRFAAVKCAFRAMDVSMWIKLCYKYSFEHRLILRRWCVIK